MPGTTPATGEKWIESMSMNAKLGSERCKLLKFYKGTPARLKAVALAKMGTFRIHDNVSADLLKQMKESSRLVE